MTFPRSMMLSTALCALLVLPATAQQSPDDVTRADFPFEKSVLVEGLADPFEVRLGPDDWLWVSERRANRLIRINPEDGTVETAFDFDMPEVLEGAQTGVMGFAFHPDFGNGSDQVFVYHSYEDEARTDPTRPDEADPYHGCSTRSCGWMPIRKPGNCRTRAIS